LADSKPPRGFHKIPSIIRPHLAARHQHGESVRSMAQMYGVHISTIKRLIRIHGGDIRSRVEGVKLAKTKIPVPDEQQIKDMYVEGEMSLRAIADKYNVHHSTISCLLSRLNVPRRGKGSEVGGRKERPLGTVAQEEGLLSGGSINFK